VEGLIIMVFVGIILLVNALIKKATEGKEENSWDGAQKNSKRDAYQASEDQVQDFLQQIQQRREQAEQKQAQRRREPAEADFEQTSPEWSAEESQEEREETTQTPASTSRQETPKSPGTRRKASTGAAARKTPRVASLPSYGEEARETRFVVRRSDLTRAVIWSEILRPPVSLRDEIGHRPISTGR
jgi:hypothetical protein